MTPVSGIASGKSIQSLLDHNTWLAMAFGASQRRRYRLRDSLGFVLAATFLFVRSNQSKIEALAKKRDLGAIKQLPIGKQRN